MSTKSPELIWGGRIAGAKIHAKHAREVATKAVRKLTGQRAGPAFLWTPSAGHGTHRSGSWKLRLSASRAGRLAPARMIKLTETRQISPYKWVLRPGG
jgi:hypothetical protein